MSELAADGASYCPAFALLDESSDEALGAALARVVVDGCAQPCAGEADPMWWSVTAMAGVAVDDEGRPAHGEGAGVVRLGRGEGVLLVTDRAAACVLTSGEWLGDAAAAVLSFDLDEVADVDADQPRLHRQVRSMTVELKGASWGAVGLAVGRDRPAAAGDAPTRTGAELVARLTAHLHR